MISTKDFRRMLSEPGIIIVPGVHDVLSAILAEKAGHKVILAGGYAVASSFLGLPDMGIITMNEMVDMVHRLSMAVDISIIADIDTGYGGVINVIRTIKEIEAAGASGVQIEDQVFPKRAGLTAGRRIISTEKMKDKIKAASDTKKNPDLVIIARTDAQPVEEAIVRSNAYYEAGADMLFIEDVHSEEEMRKINREVEAPTVVVMVEGSDCPFLPSRRLEELGFKMVYYCMSSLLASAKTVLKVMEELKNAGSSEKLIETMFSFKDFNELIGFNRYTEIQNKYGEFLE